MPRRADYPEWVTKHLAKGVYVNKVGDKYYLYKAHTEKIPGTKQSRRISDGYLGRITEKEGFIPAKRKEPRAVTLDFAVPFAVDACSQKICAGLKRSYPADGPTVYVCSILTFLYEEFTPELYKGSWLSLRYSGLDIPWKPADTLRNAIDRGTRMIQDSVHKAYGDDWHLIRAYFSPVVLILMDGHQLLPALSTPCSDLAARYHLNLQSVLKKDN